MTSGDHLTRRTKSAYGEPRDGNRWNVYRRVPSQVFLLRRSVELLHAFVRQNVHPLTAATFGDWLSPRARAHYHKPQISTVKSNDNNFLIRLRWNLDYSTKGSSQSSKGKVPVFFHLWHIYILRASIIARDNNQHYERLDSLDIGYVTFTEIANICTFVDMIHQYFSHSSFVFFFFYFFTLRTSQYIRSSHKFVPFFQRLYMLRLFTYLSVSWKMSHSRCTTSSHFSSALVPYRRMFINRHMKCIHKSRHELMGWPNTLRFRAIVVSRTAAKVHVRKFSKYMHIVSMTTI